MNKGVSLYLDLVRFGAAMIVFLGHASRQVFTDGLLWQISAYMDTAVIVFFVLSGFVIAHVLHEKEQTPKAYVIARISRLYSVVVPALMVTALCDGIGLATDPSLYNGPAEYPASDIGMRYLATLLLTNQFWIWGHAMEAGTDAPFWSLSFEAAYYIAAGFIFFTKGMVRILLCCLLGALVGPTIVALAPVWLLGYCIYHAMLRLRLPEGAGLGLALSGLFLLFFAPQVREATKAMFPLTDRNLVASYYDALSFGVHLVGVSSLSNSFLVVLGRGEKVIRWLGSLTFALYLFHRPMLWLLSALNIGPPSSWSQRAYIYSTTLLAVATIGWWCEAQKIPIRRRLAVLTWPDWRRWASQIQNGRSEK